MCYAESKKGVGIDMSEITGEWKLPKNVRQIGEGSGSTVIYVEDYVITFLEELSQSEQPKNAVLLGTVRENEGKKYIFADGALEVLEEEDQSGADREKYFKDKNVVGWFLSNRESPFVMKKESVQELAGQGQILIVRDVQEEETLVFLLEDENPVQQSGYYIYYEKNVAMREYMIAKKGGKSVEEEQPVKDEAIRRFRRIVRKKNENKETQEKKKWTLPSAGRLSYLVGGGLTATILALGVTMIYNYDHMKEVERNLAMLTSNIDSQSQYLDQDGTTPVMLHLEEEMTEVLTESETEAQTEEPVMQQGENVQTGETEQETMQAEETLRQQDAGKEKQEILQEQNLQGESETVVHTAEEETESQGQEAKETSALATTAGRASYIVRAGDTLAGISEMYYGNLEKVEEICTLNGIDDENTILPGQKILLP